MSDDKIYSGDRAAVRLPQNEKFGVYMKKIVSLIAALALLLVTSCSSGGGKTVMSLGNAKIDEATYAYWMSTYKARYLRTYTDIKDTASYWNEKISDLSEKTNEELVNGLIRDNIRSNLVAMSLYAENGLTMSDSMKDKIDSYIDSLVEELADGSRKTMNANLAEFGINLNILRTVFINEQKSSDLFDYYYGDNGKTPVTDSEREAYYEENYVRFYQINVNDAYAYAEDSDGTYQKNEDGSYKKRSLTDKEKAEKAEKIAQIEKKLSDGADFSGLYEEYSENTDYPGGYYFSLTSAGDYIADIVTKAFSLEEGEWIKYTSDTYGTFFIKRAALDDGAYSAEANADFFDDFDASVADDLYNKMITSHFGEISVDEERLNAVSVKDCKANYYYD